MPDLKMTVESVQATQQSILTTKDQLNTQVSNLSNAVNNMVGSTWIAPSATQFQQSYQDWVAAMNTKLEELGALGTRLQNEINQWQETASQLAS